MNAQMLAHGILGLFAAASLVHLIGCWRENRKLEAATKPMLIVLLLIYYVLDAPSLLNWYLAGALFASWLGDVLLMPRGDGWFAAGGIAFIAAHALFVFVYAQQICFDRMPFASLIPAAMVYIGATAAVMKRIHADSPTWMRVPIALYLFCNTAMNLFAFSQLATRPCAGSIAAYAGAVLFFISDCTLFLARFERQEKRLRKPAFVIMFTYILGELLITEGMILLYVGTP